MQIYTGDYRTKGGRGPPAVLTPGSFRGTCLQGQRKSWRTWDKL